MKITVDIPDDLATEIEQRAGDFTWSQLIVDALVYALTQADTEQETNMTDAVERHAALIDAGWRTDLDGRWVSPDPTESRFTFTLDAAWRAHQAATDPNDAA
jgi:hypothetical protein